MDRFLTIIASMGVVVFFSRFCLGREITFTGMDN